MLLSSWRQRSQQYAFFAYLALTATTPHLCAQADSADNEVEHWAFAPISRLEPPDVADSHDDPWVRNDIDRFILSRLSAEQLSPVEDAAPRALLRRVTFDLTGLPPAPAELDAFAADPSTRAYSTIVDRLLASPHFGERWGRHWMDVVRFAESSGGGRSFMYRNAWRFRDYVIASFNQDKPIDRFIVEQLAGDLLPYDNAAQRDQQVIATGMLTLGAVNYELQDKELLEYEIVDEQINAVGSGMLALTLGCARCHDHMFDPIPMTDYYGLAGIFKSTKSVTHANVGRYTETPLSYGPEVTAYKEHQQKLNKAKAAKKQAKQRVDQLVEAAQQSNALNEADEDNSVEINEVADAEAASTPEPGAHAEQETSSDEETAPAESEELVAARQDLELWTKRVKHLKDSAPIKPMAMSVSDAKEPGDIALLLNGVVRQLGPVVPRCFVSIACCNSRVGPSKIAEGQSGRLELARWIASADNPLTARVFVNRAWEKLLGEGLVRTPDNFGTMGESPSHPELLDYLTSTFIEDGWSAKSLIRRIVHSRTYQLASRSPSASPSVDPENRLLSHAHRRRLDAEAIRDAMLSISGEIDLTMGGYAIRKFAEYDHNYQFDTVRRSVYVPRFRGVQLDVFTAFDVANPNAVCGRREKSVLPTQALLLMNSDFAIRQANAAAKRLLMEHDKLDDRLEALYQHALGRNPSEAEQELALEYLGDQSDATGDECEAAWSGLCQLIFASFDFRYLH